MERLNKEANRRAVVVGIFPDPVALLRLSACVLMQSHDEWRVAERRFLSEESMAQLADIACAWSDEAVCRRCAVSMTPVGGKFRAQSLVLGDVELTTFQPQIQVVGINNLMFGFVNSACRPGRSEQPAHGPQHQPQEDRPEQTHQNPSAHPQLPAPHTNEHQDHPFQFSSRAAILRLRSPDND